MSIALLAKKLEQLADGSLEEAEIEDLDNWLWNHGDLQEDSLVPTLGPGYRGPHNNDRIIRKPLSITIQDTRPPRGGVKR